jgi:hypothetical protein
MTAIRCLLASFLPSAWPGPAPGGRVSRTEPGLDHPTAFLIAAPRGNAGGFRGMLAANAIGRSDDQSGFTVDFSQHPPQRFESLNVEGGGFGAARPAEWKAPPVESRAK